jgi:hypothetical protein
MRSKVVGLLVLSLTGSTVHASPIVVGYLDTLAQAGRTGLTFAGDFDSTGNLFGADTGGPIESSATSIDESTAGANAVLRDGVLGARATGVGATTGIANATFTDTLTLTSTSLAPNSPVQLLFTMDLHYSLFYSECPQGDAGIEAKLNIRNIAQITYADSFCNGLSPNNQISILVPTFVGQELIFDLSLRVATLSAHAIDTASGLHGIGSAEAFDSLRAFADPQGDFSYVATSGNTYFTPAPQAVPEPATLTMLGAGIAGVLARGRRRRQTNQSRNR